MPSFTIPTTQQQAAIVNRTGFASNGGKVPNVRPEAVGEQFYRDGRIDNDYSEDAGIRILPSTGPAGTPPRIVRVHGGFCVRIVQWTAERVNAWPVPPSAETGDDNQVLMFRSRRPLTPLMGPNGDTLFRLAGTYIYALAVTPTESDQLAAGTAAWDADPSWILPAYYDTTQLQSGSAAPSGAPAVPNIKDLVGENI